MIVSLAIGAVLTVLGSMLLFHAKHIDGQKNKEIAAETIIAYVVLIIALLCGAISAIFALNTNNIFVVVVGGVEVVASAIAGLFHFFSWMDSDIKEGHPSN